MVCELNGNLVIRFTDYSTSDPFLSFLGTNVVEETVEVLLNYSLDNGLPLTLALMPNTTSQHIASSAMAVQEDRDNFDYVYLISQLLTLAGNQLQKLRYKSNKFKRRNPFAISRLLDMNDCAMQDQILAIMSTWEKNKINQGKDYEIDHELTAMRRLFGNFLNGDMISVGVLHPAGLLGFIILEILPESHAICHFSKGDITHDGIYEYLMQESAKHLLDRGVELLNFEQDLGIPNLRQAKLAFRPHQFLKKYRVSRQTPISNS